MDEQTRNPNVDESFENAVLWRQEGLKLRDILLECDLTEELKWGKPCYTRDGKNVCIVQRMKGFLALLFFKGALLEDADKVLEVQGPNSRSGYRMRFTSVDDVAKAAKTTKAYVREAIEIEKAGLEVQKANDVDYPKELLDKFAQDPELEAAFDRLTPGRKRGYAMHFADAKQAKTRTARIEKYRRHIVAGKGVHDR